MESSITDKKTIGEKFGDRNVLNKKPPSNTKYRDVQKTIDTGKTIKDVQILSDQYVSKRKTELFKRVKGSTIVKLLGESNNTESIYNLAEESGNNNENINTKSAARENESVYSYKTDLTDMTSKTSVTAVTYATEMLGNLALLSYIMLDLREKSDYDNYHIKEALSFPAPNISRDKFLKNIPDKLIILYGSDERNSVPSANLLLQKGYENIFLLSGGIEEFVKEYPEKCDGPGVQQLINEKLQQEILKKDALLKTAKSKKKASNSMIINDTKSVSDFKQTSTKSSVISSTTNRNSISNLKKNLQK